MKTLDYPSNKQHFKRLIPFAKKIIRICKKNNIEPVLYGSFAHFYYVRKKMKVNDIDLIIPKKDFDKIAEILIKKGFHIDYIKSYPDNGMRTIIIKSGKLKVELDEVGTGYKTLKESSLSKGKFNKIDFYGINLNIVSLDNLEDIYVTALGRTKDSKDKIKSRIENLERFLGRKLRH